MTGSLRRLCRRAFDKWLTSTSIKAMAREVLRAIVAKADLVTAASHPRYPITLAAIAAYLNRSVSTVCRALDFLEAHGLVVRRRASYRRRSDGKVYQLPTDYELTLPPECHRDLTHAKDSAAARDDQTYAPRIDDAPSHEDGFDGALSDDELLQVMTIRGTQREPRDAVHSWDVAGFADVTIGEEMPAEVLAQKLVDAGSIAIERVPESRKFVAMNCMLELKRRSMQVALTACQIGLTAGRAIGCVRQWVEKTLGNVKQEVKSGAHGLNVLRVFFRDAMAEARRVIEGARRDGLERHRGMFDAPNAYEGCGIRVNRV